MASLRCVGRGLVGLVTVQRGEQVIHDNPAVSHHPGAAAVQGGHQRNRPQVLVDQDAGQAAGLNDRSDLVEVGLVEQTGRRAVSHRHVDVAPVLNVA
jgi:hypothetical protein